MRTTFQTMIDNEVFSPTPTGVPLLDATHRSLQFLLDHMFHPQVMCSDQGGRCARISDTSRFLVRNMAHEEQLMREASYPAIAAHQRAHNRMLRALARMEHSMVCGHYDNRRVFAFLARWMNRHVTAFDKPFADFLATREGER